MVPQGNFKNQKFITGRKVEELLNESSFTLKLPFDDFIGLKHLTEDLEFGTKSFIANHGGLTDWPAELIQGSILTSEGEVPSDTAQQAYDDLNLIWAWDREEGGGPTIETKLAIQCNVETLLAHYRPKSGRYGLRVVLTGMTKSTEEFSSHETVEEMYFTNNDMYGNTYAYSVPVVQQKIFDISDLISVSSIRIYFWQDHNFYDEGNKYIAWRNVNEELYPANISFSDLQVYLGLTTDEINDERVFLYTYDDITYGENAGEITDRAELDTRTMHIGWVHRDYASDSFVLVNRDELLSKYGAKIFWYQMEYDTPIDGSKLEDRLGGANWKYLPEYLNKFSVSVIPSIEKSKEKYKVVVYYPGAQITSEPLVFTNVIDVESNNAALAANKELIFKFYRPVTQLEKVAIGENGLQELLTDGNGNYLTEDPTIGQFLVYDENNQCLANSDEIVFSNIDYYVEINLQTKDENNEATYVPLYTDDLVPFTVEYAKGEMMSMFQIINLDKNDIFFGSLYSEDNGPGQAQWNRILATIKKIRIANFWNVNYNNNVLSATVIRNGRDYYINKEFVFGQSGSQGSEYTVKIDLNTGSNYAIVKGKEYQIAAYVYDRQGSMLQSDMIRFNWELIGPSYSAQYATGESDEQWTKITVGDNFHYNGIAGFIRNDYPPIFKVTVIGAADYPITAIRGFALTNSANGAATQENVILCPDRIEYKSDGTQPIYDTSDFEVQKLIDGTLIYPGWEMIYETLDGENYVEVPLDQRKFELIPTIHYDTQMSTNYGMQERPLYVTYKLTTELINKDSLNRFSWYWDPVYEKQDYMCLSCQIDDNTWIRQAIAFAHNIYASSLINSWDGSLTLDSGNGALLSKMVSAGTKDSDNRFTGVIMGDWQDNADSSLDAPGLYGFKKGKQTFGFRSDGTGFIGAAGQGQIKIDGTQAVISNYDESCYINLNPIRYSFNNNLELVLDEESKASFSPYFLYTKTPRTADVYGTYENLNYIYDTETNLTSWTRPFMEDTNNDYFIVDPNNGILTTGGIIARYGKIGDWMISQEGLYQKNKEMKHFMYLGTTAGLISQREAIDAEYENRKSKAYDDYVYDLLANVNTETANIYLYDPLHYWNEARYAKKAEEILTAALAEINERTTSEEIQTIVETKIREADIVEFQDSYAHAHFNQYGRPDVDYAARYNEAIYKGIQNTGTSSLLTGLWPVLGYTPTFTTEDRPVTYTPTNRSTSRKTYLALTKLTRKNSVPETYSRTIPSTSNTIPTAGIFTDYIDTPGFYFNTSGWPTKLPPISKWSDGTYNKQICKCLTTFSIQCIKDVIASLPAVYEGYQALYNFQMELQLALVLKSVPEDVKKSIEDDYKTTLETIESEYKAKLEALENEAKNIRYAIFAGQEEYTNPVFYVKWNGDMFARRGLIANTWTIDDHALTYSKNNDIMYLGTEGSAYDGYKPFGRVLKPTQTALDTDDTKNDTRRWAFSASDQAELDVDEVSGHLVATKPYEINFGVTMAGELYAQKGTIAGWYLNRDSLTKYVDNNPNDRYLIKLDSKNARIAMVEQEAAKNNPIILFDALSDPPVAQIGVLGQKAVIKLAGYNIVADTSGALTLNDSALTAGSLVAATTIKLENWDLWDDVSISDELQNATSYTILNLQNSPGLSQPHFLNSLSTVNDSSTYYFAIKHPDSDHSALKIYTNTGDSGSTSGTNSKIILEPNAAYGVLGTANAPWAIYGSEAYFKSNVFAQNMLVYDSIISSGSTNGDEVSGYFPVASKEYVNYRFQELGNYTTALGQAVYKAFVSARSRINKLWKAIGTTVDEEGNIVNQEGKIKQAVIKFGKPTVTPGDGNIDITIPYTQIEGSGSININFNIADTAYFRKHAVDKARTEAVGGVTSHVLVIHPDESESTYDTNKLSLNSEEDKVVQSNSAGTTVAEISLAGYKDAIIANTTAEVKATSVSMWKSSPASVTFTSNGTYDITIAAQAKNAAGTVIASNSHTVKITINVPTNSVKPEIKE